MANEATTRPADKYFVSAGRDIKAELRRSQPAYALKRFDAVRPAIHPCSKLQIIPAKANKKPPGQNRGVSRGAVTLVYAFFPPTYYTGRIPQSVTNTPESPFKTAINMPQEKT